VKGSEWAGVGWHKFGSADAGMHDADFAIAVWTAGKLNVTDRKANDMVNNGFTAPLLDTSPTVGGKNDITVFSGSQMDGMTTFSFTKALDTGDTKGDWPLTESGFYHVIVAYGTSNAFGNHGNKDRENYLINWATGDSKPCTTNTCV